MGLFQDDRPPELYVPDLTKAAGAVIDADGNVTCVACGNKLPVAKADIVGQGYRCAACTGKAQLAALTGGSDVDANLSASDRKDLRNAGLKMILPGVGLLVAGICVLVAGAGRAGGYMIVAGGGGCIAGFVRMTAAR